MGLKGNLDMCLASRLSTQANLGNMDSKKELLKMILGNIGLVQVIIYIHRNYHFYKNIFDLDTGYCCFLCGQFIRRVS